MSMITALALFSVALFGSVAARASEVETKAATPGAAVGAAASSPSKATWFQGAVEEAFAEAKRQNKPLLLFWTAVWCPYCNEIKSAVFSRPQFQELMQQTIPLLLDGDSERAQIYSDKFKFAGFPTVVFFSSQGEELTRFSENLTMDEFQRTFESIVSSGMPVVAIVEKAKHKRASPQEWHALARFPWGDPEAPINAKPETALLALEVLASDCPADLSSERASLAASFLSAVASEDPSDKKLSRRAKGVLRRARVEWKRYFEAIHKSDESLFAARSFVLSAGDEFVPWLAKFARKQDVETVVTSLLEDLSKLRSNSELPVYHWLETYAAELTLAQKEWEKPASKGSVTAKQPPESKPPVPAELAAKIAAASEESLAKATSALVRQPTVSLAAALLSEVGQKDRARDVLVAESKKSDTPYYFQSSLARMAEKQGDFRKALEWSDAAAQAATGRMTKPRWMVMDLGLRLKLKDKVDAAEFERDFPKRLDAFFKVTMVEPDAFSGGNLKRTKSLLGKLGDWAKTPEHKELIKSWQGNCAVQPESSRETCRSTFAALLK